MILAHKQFGRFAKLNRCFRKAETWKCCHPSQAGIEHQYSKRLVKFVHRWNVSNIVLVSQTPQIAWLHHATQLSIFPSSKVQMDQLPCEQSWKMSTFGERSWFQLLSTPWWHYFVCVYVCVCVCLFCCCLLEAVLTTNLMTFGRKTRWDFSFLLANKITSTAVSHIVLCR